MQTTLLSVAIAVILALVAALVAPIFVDWSRYRAEFEARATRLTGLEFRVTGPIAVRLLPTPTLTLQGIEFGPPNDSKVRARTLHIEFALSRLLQGEWRIEDARLEAPELAISFDQLGRVAWPLPPIGTAPEGVSIQRLTISDGRAALAHDASGSRLELGNIDFKGELRSLTGPVRGEGSFVAAGSHYPYRINMARIADDGSVKICLNIDPIDPTLSVEADFSIRVDRGVPRLEGGIAFARPAGRVPGGEITVEPWRVTSRFQTDVTSASFGQIELQYGRDDRAIKLRGDAKLTFGTQPQLNAVMTSPQIDLDRMLSLPEEIRRRPLVVIRTLAGYFSGGRQAPFPLKLRLSTETLTMAGAPLQRVTGDVSIEGTRWEIAGLELRAPGLTQMRASGRLDATSTGTTFEGPIRINSSDPRALVAWLIDRVDPRTIAAGPFRLSGDVALGSARIALDRFNAEIDRMNVTGGLAYSWAGTDRPARLDATLTAPEIDIDRVHALARSMLGDTDFDRPRQGSLTLKIGRASFGGVEVKQSDVSMRIDSDGLEIERLAVADFAGAAVAAKGRIDTRGQSPRGAVTLDFDAHSLDGLLALIERFAREPADQLRRLAGRVTPVVLRASLALDPASLGGTGTNATATFKLDGRAGRFRIALQGDSGVASDVFKLDDLTTLGTAQVDLAGRLEADDGGALVDLLGLAPFFIVESRPGVLRISAKGPLDGELAVDGRLSASALNISASGTARFPPGKRPTAGLEIQILNANVPSPRAVARGRTDELLQASATLRLELSEATLGLLDIKGAVAGTDLGGQLSIGIRQQPISLEGNFDVGAWDLPAMISTAIGIPATSSNETGLWPAEPFGPGLRGAQGQITVRAKHVVLTPKLAGRDLQTKLHFGESQLALQVIDGSIAGGRIAGELIFLREAAGLIARTHVKVSGANAAELLPGDGALTGRLTFEVAAEGAGMSPSALIGALQGRGSFTLTNGRVARLNPNAFDTVLRAFDRGVPVDAARVRDRMNAALANGTLGVRRAEAGVSIEGGQLRMLSNPVLDAPAVDLVVNGRANLVEGTIDARLALSGARSAGAAASTRPEIEVVLKGPIDNPRRTLEVGAFVDWMAMRALEQQSKKLDMLEAREPAANPSTTNALPPIPALPSPDRTPASPR